MLRVAAAVALGLLLAGCARPGAPDLPNLPELHVSSSAYRDGDPVPREFTCDGFDRSPPLVVSGFPAGARYWALVFDDPDAARGTWTHWTFWDVPTSVASLPAGANIGSLGGVEGTTSAKTVGYHGPCPPSGAHRYIMHAYATEEKLGIPPGSSVEQVHQALRSKAVAQGVLNATYARS